MEIAFSALNVWPNLSRSTSTHGDFSSSARTRSDEDRKTKEVITLLARREKDSKNIFNVGLLMSLVITHPNVPRGRKSIRDSLRLGEIEIIYMLMKMRNLMKELKVRLMLN